MTALADRNDVVDAGREGMREFQPEIDGLSADAADGLCGIDLLLVGFKLRSLRAVVIRPRVRSARLVSGHGVSPFTGMKKHPDFRVLVYMGKTWVKSG